MKLRTAGSGLLLIGLVVLLIASGGCGDGTQEIAWHGNPPETAKPFRPGYFGTRFEPHSALEIHPNDHEITWSIFWREVEGFHQKVVAARFEDNQFTIPSVTSFSAGYSCGGPQYSPDGTTLYFTSERPIGDELNPHNRIWTVQRDSSGWGTPEPLDAPFNEETVSSQFALMDDGTIIFSRRVEEPRNNDLFIAEFVDGQYQPERSLPGAVNTEYLEADPWIDPQGRFLLFGRFDDLEHGFGGMDLCISVRQPDGTWGEGVSLGETVNSFDEERFPSLSPDGHVLFFTRMTGEGYDIRNSYYWISAESVPVLAEVLGLDDES